MPARSTASTRRPATLRARTATRSALGLAIGVATSGNAIAGNAIEVVEVYGQQGVPYKAVRSGDLRHAHDLASTPQTITVLTQSQLRDAGRTDLKDILAAQAGITLGTGENGNAFGDRYVIRGHEARSDVFVDGVRDPGMTTRESFATEQVEITKGPSSTFAGRGSTGGAVNSITKQALADEHFNIVEGSIGSDNHHRVTLDSNHQFGDRVALRANLLHASEEVPDRGPAERQRKGALVSARVSATDNLSIVADGYWLEADDVPDLGAYFDRSTRRVVDVPVYLQEDSDFLDTEVRTFTLKADWQLAAHWRLTNATRVGETANGYVTTGARGGTRDASDPDAPSAPTLTLSSHQGWQDVDYRVNQTNLFWDVATGDMQHRVVFGLEFTDEQVSNGTYRLTDTGATNCILPGSRGRPTGPGYCGLDAEGNPVANLTGLLDRTVARGARDSDFQVETLSAYVMDTVEVSDRWSLFFGVRHDRFDYRNDVVSRGTPLTYDYDDGFWNGHLGVVRTIGAAGNVYATVSTATNINGGESDVGSSCGYGGLCGTPEQVAVGDPEQTLNLEFGTKWNLFGDRLLATAAVFRITKDDVMESVGDSYSTLGTLNTGRNRVQGIEVSLTGSITEQLSVQANAAFMDAEVLDAFDPADEGRTLANFAEESAWLQLRYDATPRLSFGGAVTWQGEMYAGQPDTAAGFDASIGDYSIVVPDYRTLDLFLNWYPTEAVNLRLNVANATDEDYWRAAYRSGAFMYIGDRRNVRATLTWTL